MTYYGDVGDLMPLNETRFEHYESGSDTEKSLEVERDIMVIEEPVDVDRNEELEMVSLINGEEKATVGSCGEKDTPGTYRIESIQDHESLGLSDKILNQTEERCEKEKQVDHNEELEKANLTNGDANPTRNNCGKPKQGTSEKGSSKGQKKSRISLTKELSAKHVKVKRKKATNKRKTDTRSIHKQGFYKDVLNQDNVVTKSNNWHRSSYIPSKKLNQSLRLGIIFLAVLCTVHISEESSVKWQLRSLVHFGKTAVLDCILNETSNVCHNDSVTRRWTKHGHQTTSILTINGHSSNKSKYEEEVNKHCTVSSLIIKNFDHSDIADYTCGFGFKEDSKELKVEGGNFRSLPAKENINGILLCSHSNLTLDLKMRNIFPGPKCYSNIENDGVKHKRIRTDLSGVLYTTEDTVEFVLKDGSCSGTIRTFCLFEETKIEVFNRTYDCCQDSHSSLALKVSMGCLGVITFAVIMCFVYLCTRKKIGCIQDLFLQSAELTRSETALSAYLESVESEG